MIDRAYWIWLQQALGPAARADDIVSSFGSPEDFFTAGVMEWRLSGVLSPKQIERLKSSSLLEAEKTRAFCERNGWQLIAPDDELYPSLLRGINDYPLMLYVQGDIGRIKNKLTVSVVGTRSASNYSVEVATRLCASLARSGVAVVSGGALGIDSAAHTGVLGVGGVTVAVLGCGIDYPYIMSNQALRAEIAKTGAVVSEYPPSSPPLASNFPKRNRIISGLSLGTVVIEAGERSGSLITANLAAEQGRDVFAVPGDLISSAHTGANKLIRNGAKPVFSAADILEEYIFHWQGSLEYEDIERVLAQAGESLAPIATRTNRAVPPPPVKKRPPPAPSPQPVKKQPAPSTLSEQSQKIYSLFGSEALHIDDIVRLSGLPASNVFSALTELEIYGLIALNSGKRYTLR